MLYKCWSLQMPATLEHDFFYFYKKIKQYNMSHSASMHKITVKPACSLWLQCVHFMRMIRTYVRRYLFTRWAVGRKVRMDASTSIQTCMSICSCTCFCKCMHVYTQHFSYHHVSNIANSCISCSIPPMKMLSGVSKHPSGDVAPHQQSLTRGVSVWSGVNTIGPASCLFKISTEQARELSYRDRVRVRWSCAKWFQAAGQLPSGLYFKSLKL